MTDVPGRIGLIDDEDLLLDEAALELAALDHDGVDLAPYRATIDAIEERLRADAGDEEDHAARADALARVIAGEFGFTGDRDSYDDPANADLVRVIDRRRGLPVALSLLYVVVARRLGWEVDALDVPGHVLVLVGREDTPVIVDPFRGGAVVRADELARLLASEATRDGDEEVHRVAALPDRAVLVRMVMNQATRAEAGGRGRRALELYERMTAFAPEYGQAWWSRARLELVDGRVGDARSSLSAMLEITRDPELRARVSETLEALDGD